MSLLRVGRTPENSRKYVPGDQVSLIDWKAFARTDNLIVRQQRDEASARIIFVIDCTETMKWPSDVDRENLSEPQKKIISKSDLAIRIAFWLMHSHLVSGDSGEIWIRESGDLPQLKWTPRSPLELMSVYRSCEDDLTLKIREYFINGTWSYARNDLLWILCDGIDSWNFENIMENSRKMHFVQLLSSLEISTDWMEEETCYLDKGIVNKDYLGRQLKQGGSFQNSLETWRSSIRERVKQIDGEYFFATDRTPVAMLIHFLHVGAREK